MESAPAVATPDPTTTAAAQTASNKQTAITQQELNQTNQVSPDGTKTYAQTGVNSDGTPQFTQTTSLSAPNQAIYDTNLGTKQNIATIGKDQSAKIGSLLGTPFSVDQSIADKITSLGKTNLDPEWAQRKEAFDTEQANAGALPGSAAYNNAYRDFTNSRSQAYNNLYLQGDAQAEQESLAQRNQPINEISALMSGSQVGTPTFGSTPQTSVAGTDVAGITQNSYLDANQQAQQSVAANNAMMGGLFGLAGTAATAGIKYSDRRLKTDIRRVGTTARGLPLYEYTIFGKRERGVMADEVERVMPSAVVEGAFGLKRVNYAMLEAA